MIEPADHDIAEALRLDGWAMTRTYEVAIIRAHASTYRQILSHARTIAKLRVATEALERAHETMHQTTAVLTATDCADVAKTMAVVRHAIAQIKGPTHDH